MHNNHIVMQFNCNHRIYRACALAFGECRICHGMFSKSFSICLLPSCSCLDLSLAGRICAQFSICSSILVFFLVLRCRRSHRYLIFPCKTFIDKIERIDVKMFLYWMYASNSTYIRFLDLVFIKLELVQFQLQKSLQIQSYFI